MPLEFLCTNLIIKININIKKQKKIILLQIIYKGIKPENNIFVLFCFSFIGNLEQYQNCSIKTFIHPIRSIKII